MTIETRQKIISWSQWLAGMWVVLTFLAVVACGYSLLVASVRVGCYVLSIGLWAVAFEAISHYKSKFPLTKRLFAEVENVFNRSLELLNPEKLDAWSAKGVVTLIGGVGVFFLVTTASSGWLTILTGFLASIVMGVALWVMMSLVDNLQKWAERTGRKFYGALILIGSLGAFWIILVFAMNWLSGKSV